MLPPANHLYIWFPSKDLLFGNIYFSFTPQISWVSKQITTFFGAPVSFRKNKFFDLSTPSLRKVDEGGNRKMKMLLWPLTLLPVNRLNANRSCLLHMCEQASEWLPLKSRNLLSPSHQKDKVFMVPCLLWFWSWWLLCLLRQEWWRVLISH